MTFLYILSFITIAFQKRSLLSTWAFCTIYNVLQCTMFNVQCLVYSVKWTLFNVQCTVFSIQCTLYSLHCSVSSVQYTIYNVHCTLYIPVFNLKFLCLSINSRDVNRSIWCWFNIPWTIDVGLIFPEQLMTELLIERKVNKQIV